MGVGTHQDGNIVKVLSGVKSWRSAALDEEE